MKTEHYILLDDRRTGNGARTSRLFIHPCAEVVCCQPNEMAVALARIEQYRQQGYFVVGYLSYEAAYALDFSLIPHYPFDKLSLPLLHFFIYRRCHRLSEEEVEQFLSEQSHALAGSEQRRREARAPPLESLIYNLRLGVNEVGYYEAIARILTHIQDGETYQVNYTTKYHFDFQGYPLDFYKKLRAQQKVAYSALMVMGDTAILSLSPELFFRKTGHTLIVKPMKGTMPRSTDSVLDAEHRAFLVQDPKSISENIIIVDLLRNDLSKLVARDSLEVRELLQVETYETVHQMVSTITGQVEINTPFEKIIQALFPCGSVTGAPKRRTLSIIHALEAQPRLIYTGAIGYITPDNDMCFNVPIRTVLLQNNRGEMGVGGGIIAESKQSEEFNEVKLKGRFMTTMAVDFKLLECFLFEAERGFHRLEAHLARLKRSAEVFAFYYPPEIVRILHQQASAYQTTGCLFKVRLELDKKGYFTIDFQEIFPVDAQPKVKLYLDERINPADILYYHKTSHSAIRQFYDRIYQAQSEAGKYFDIILANRDGLICEGTRSNIFIRQQNCWMTPSESCGLLPGVMRNIWLDEQPDIVCTALTIDQLKAADEIILTNSVRGKVKVTLCH